MAAQASENILGSLRFIKKDGTDGMEVPLTNEICSIGTSGTVRIKSNDPKLKEIHCEIAVEKTGLASITNKAPLAPVKINGIKLTKSRYLKPGDVLDVLGKTWRYENNYLSENILAKLNTSTRNPVFKTPMKNRMSLLQSVASGKRKMSMTPDPKKMIPIVPRRKRSNSFASANEFEVTEDSDPRNIEPFKTPGKRKSIRVRIGGTSRFSTNELSTPHLKPSKVISTPQRQGLNVITPTSVLKPGVRSDVLTPRVLALKNTTKCNMEAQNSSQKPRLLWTPTSEITSDTAEEVGRDVRTPVTEKCEDMMNFTTPLNNSSIVLIDSPVKDSTPARSKKVKNMSIQRLTENDDSIIILDTPDSKTPKSVLKGKHPLNITKSTLYKTKVMAELLEASTPAKTTICIDDNESSEEDNEISRINDKELSGFSNFTEESVYESSCEELDDIIRADGSPMKDTSLKTADNTFNRPTPSKSANKSRKSTTFIEENITDYSFTEEMPSKNVTNDILINISSSPINISEQTIELASSPESYSEAVEPTLKTPGTASKTPKSTMKRQITAKLSAKTMFSTSQISIEENTPNTSSALPGTSKIMAKSATKTRESLMFFEESLHDSIAPDFDDKTEVEATIVTKTPLKVQVKTRQSMPFVEEELEDTAAPDCDDKTEAEVPNENVVNQVKTRKSMPFVEETLEDTAAPDCDDKTEAEAPDEDNAMKTPSKVQTKTRPSIPFVEESLKDAAASDNDDKTEEEVTDTKTDHVMKTPLKVHRKTRQSMPFVVDILDESVAPDCVDHIDVETSTGNVVPSNVEIDLSEIDTPKSVVHVTVPDEVIDLDTFKTPDSNTPLLSKITMKQKKSTVKVTETNTTPKGISPVTIARSRRSLVNFKSMSSTTSSTDSDDSIEETSEFAESSDTAEATEEGEDCAEETERSVPKRGAKRHRESIPDDDSMAILSKRAKHNIYTSSESSSFLDASDVSSPFKSDNYLNESEKELSVLQENEDKLHNVLIDSPAVNIPLKKAATEPRNKRERASRRSLPTDTMANQENVPEDVFDCGDTTVESIDTSSFIYLAGEESAKKIQPSASHQELEAKSEGDQICNKSNFLTVTSDSESRTSPIDLLELGDSTSQDTSMSMRATSECFPIEGENEEITEPISQTELENNITNPKDIKSIKTPKPQNSSEIDLTDVKGMKEFLKTPKTQKDTNNDLSNVVDVKELLKTPKLQKQPKNDLTNISGVKELLKTPKLQKEPNNDLTNVAGVKKLLKTPKLQKEPNNDLTNVAGVKKLLKTPKLQKEPNNDLTNVAGVKNLLKTPKLQKEPNNDLTNVAGVKKLLKTPKLQKEPINDLTNVAGVKKLLKTPKLQKEPINDLSNVAGVKELLETPKRQKDLKNDLSNISGVKELLKTPIQQDRKNAISSSSGVKELFGTSKADLPSGPGVKQLPKTPKPQKDLNDCISRSSGVKELHKTPKSQDLNNDLPNVTQPKELLKTPKQQRGPKNDLSNLSGVKELLETPRPQRSQKKDVLNLPGAKELLKTPKLQKVLPLLETKELSETSKIHSMEENVHANESLDGPKSVNKKSPRENSLFNSSIVLTDTENDMGSPGDINKLKLTPKVDMEADNDISDIDGIEDLYLSPENKPNVDITVKSSILNISGVESLEDFDLLLTKKPLRTYKGRSFSPNRWKEEHHSRKTLGGAPDVSPNVKKWVDELDVISANVCDDSIVDICNEDVNKDNGSSAHEDSFVKNTTVNINEETDNLSPSKQLRTSEIRIRIQNSEVKDDSPHVFTSYSHSAKSRASFSVTDKKPSLFKARKTLPSSFIVNQTQVKDVILNSPPISKIEQTSFAEEPDYTEVAVETPNQPIEILERTSSTQKLTECVDNDRQTPVKPTQITEVSSKRKSKKLGEIETSVLESTIIRTDKPGDSFIDTLNITSPMKMGVTDSDVAIEPISFKRKSKRSEENDNYNIEKSSPVYTASPKRKSKKLNKIEASETSPNNFDHSPISVAEIELVSSNERILNSSEKETKSLTKDYIDEIIDNVSPIKERKSLRKSSNQQFKFSNNESTPIVQRNSSGRKSIRLEVNDENTPAKPIPIIDSRSSKRKSNKLVIKDDQTASISKRTSLHNCLDKNSDIEEATPITNELTLVEVAESDNTNLMKSLRSSKVGLKLQEHEIDEHTPEKVFRSTEKRKSKKHSLIETSLPDAVALEADIPVEIRTPLSESPHIEEVEADKNNVDTLVKPILSIARSSSRHKSKENVKQYGMKTPIKQSLIIEKPSSKAKSKKVSEIESDIEAENLDVVTPKKERKSLGPASNDEDPDFDKSDVVSSKRKSRATEKSLQTTPLLKLLPNTERVSSRNKSKNVEVSNEVEADFKTPIKPTPVIMRVSSKRKITTPISEKVYRGSAKKIKMHDIGEHVNITPEATNLLVGESTVDEPVAPRSSARKQKKKDFSYAAMSTESTPAGLESIPRVSARNLKNALNSSEDMLVDESTPIISKSESSFKISINVLPDATSSAKNVLPRSSARKQKNKVVVETTPISETVVIPHLSSRKQKKDSHVSSGDEFATPRTLTKKQKTTDASLNISLVDGSTPINMQSVSSAAPRVLSRKQKNDQTQSVTPAFQEVTSATKSTRSHRAVEDDATPNVALEATSVESSEVPTNKSTRARRAAKIDETTPSNILPTRASSKRKKNVTPQVGISSASKHKQEKNLEAIEKLESSERVRLPRRVKTYSVDDRDDIKPKETLNSVKLDKIDAAPAPNKRDANEVGESGKEDMECDESVPSNNSRNKSRAKRNQATKDKVEKLKQQETIDVKEHNTSGEDSEEESDKSVPKRNTRNKTISKVSNMAEEGDKEVKLEEAIKPKPKKSARNKLSAKVSKKEIDESDNKDDGEEESDDSVPTKILRNKSKSKSTKVAKDEADTSHKIEVDHKEGDEEESKKSVPKKNARDNSKSKATLVKEQKDNEVKQKTAIVSKSKKSARIKGITKLPTEDVEESVGDDSAESISSKNKRNSSGSKTTKATKLEDNVTKDEADTNHLKIEVDHKEDDDEESKKSLPKRNARDNSKSKGTSVAKEEKDNEVKQKTAILTKSKKSARIKGGTKLPTEDVIESVGDDSAEENDSGPKTTMAMKLEDNDKETKPKEDILESKKSARNKKGAKLLTKEVSHSENGSDEEESKDVKTNKTLISKSTRNRRGAKVSTKEVKESGRDEGESDESISKESTKKSKEQENEVSKKSTNKRGAKHTKEADESGTEDKESVSTRSTRNNRSKPFTTTKEKEDDKPEPKKTTRNKRGTQTASKEVDESNSKPLPKKTGRVKIEESKEISSPKMVSKAKNTVAFKDSIDVIPSKVRGKQTVTVSEETRSQSEDSESEVEVVKRVVKTTKSKNRKDVDVEETTTLVKPNMTTVVHKVTKSKATATNKTGKKRLRSMADIDEVAGTVEVEEKPKKFKNNFKVDEQITRKSARTRK